jgi:hypothetical protein
LFRLEEDGVFADIGLERSLLELKEKLAAPEYL